MFEDVYSNVASDDTCRFAGAEEHSVDDIGLNGLAVNGNPNRIGPNQTEDPVKTMAFKFGSELFNAMSSKDDGDYECPLWAPNVGVDAREDARGVVRPRGSACDIGAYEAPVVSGVVWDERGSNEAKDPGEGVNGVTVQLLGGPRVVATATTDSEGVYAFPVTPGDWKVKVPAATNSINTALRRRLPITPTSADVSVTDAADALNVDFGYQQPSQSTILVNALTGRVLDDDVCTLEEALKSANDDALPTDRSGQGVDECVRGAGADKIWITVPGTINAPSGGFEIGSDVTIQGHADGTTINGASAGLFALFAVDVGKLAAGGGRHAVSAVTLRDLTVTGARDYAVHVRDAVHVQDDGTSVPVARRYDVLLDGVHVDDNKAGIKYRGSGPPMRPGLVRVAYSVIEGNVDKGLLMDACSSDSHDRTLEIDTSVVSGNGTTGIIGGGVGNECGHLRVVDSIISGNTAGHGGGVGVMDGKSEMSTRTDLINTTITGNKAVNPNGWGGGGGGVHAELRLAGYEPSLFIMHSAIAGNVSEKVRADLPGGDPGGAGLGFEGAVDVTVSNSVVADNRRVVGNSPFGSMQCDIGTARLTETHNASSDNTCGFTSADSHQGDGTTRLDVKFEKETDGSLKPAVNGNPDRIGPYRAKDPARTVAFKAGSPLFDGVTGAGAQCPYVATGLNASKDARGVARPQPQRGRCDIGALEAHLISGTVWDDANANQQKEDDEGTVGVTVQLVKAAGTDDEVVVDTAITGTAGMYAFPVTPGNWTVRVAATDANTNTMLASLLATTPTFKDVAVSVTGANVSGVDFGYVAPAKVTGRVWVDKGADGTEDPGDTGDTDRLRAVKVSLVDSNGVVKRPDGSTATAFTNGDGEYSIDELRPGSYKVRF